jgi:hypothetical protein
MGVTLITLGLAPEPYPINTGLLKAIGDEGFYYELSDWDDTWMDKVTKKLCVGTRGEPLTGT